MSPILTPLAPFRDRLNIVTGLAHHQADSLGDGGADHARSSATWLNGVHPKKTEGEDVRAAVTIDQLAAQKIGQDTPFPSLEVGTEDFTGLVGACDAGYSCAYMNTVSWRTATAPLPMEINPRMLFERLFGEPGTPAERRARSEEDISVLDAITGQMDRFKNGLGPRDRVRVSEYLENVREIERRIQKAEKLNTENTAMPAAPAGIPDSYEEHVRLMFDLLALAYQADISRVFTFMLARELSQRTYPQVGVNDPHHATSHHLDDPVKIEKLIKIQTYHATLFARFLEKLRSTPDGDGNLLDHSMILYGSCMSNSNLHSHSPLPTLLAGGAAGRLQGGRHLRYPDRTPMSNLLLNVLDRVDIHLDAIGDSTGRLAGV
jgi:hypothetical protein